MVKKILFSLLVVMTGLIIISCNGLVIPSKVQVKGSPSVYAPLGSKTVTLSEYLNTDDIREMMGADQPDSTMKVYEYPFTAGTTTPTFAPGVADDNMRFLVHYPLAEIPLDLSEYLDPTQFGGDIADSIPPQNFTVPEIASPEATEIDFNGLLLTTLNVIPALTVPVVTLGVAQVTTPPINLLLTGFSSATFSVGTMTLEINPGTTTGLQITGVRILDNSGIITLASATGLPVNLVGTKTVSILLVGVTLTNNVKIAFDITASNATSGNLNVIPRFSTDTRLSDATGVTLSEQSLPVPAISIPAINDSSFVEATIATGNITLAINPAATSGVITGFNRSLTLNITGGLNAGVSNNTANPHVISLDGETFTGAEIEMSGDVTLASAGTGASFSNLGTTGLVFSVAPSVNIDKFSSVTMNTGNGFELVHSVSVPLPQEMMDRVKTITFTKVGLNLTFTNALPVGNNIGLNVISTAFELIDTTEVKPIEAHDPSVSEQISFTNNNELDFDPTATPNIDFTVTFTPPGYNPGAGRMTLVNLEPGMTYSLSLDSAEPVTEWTTLVADPGQSFTGSFPEVGGTPLDLSTLSQYLGEGLSFAEIPMYLYISGTTIQMTATVSALYRDKTGDFILEPTYLLGTGPDVGQEATINAVNPLVIDALSGIVRAPLSPASAPLIGFSDILSDSPSDLTLTYDITITEITVSNTPGNDPVDPLKADLVIVLPLAFVANGTGSKAVIEFDSLMGENPTDLLGRKEGEEDKSLDDVFNNLKSMTMDLSIKNNLGLQGSLIVEAESSIPGDDSFRQEIVLGEDGIEKISRLKLEKKDIEFIKNNPFIPSFSLEIPNGTYHLKKNAGMDVKITLSIETDIDYSIDLQGGK